MDNTARSPRACAQFITRGPGRTPGASLYTRNRLSRLRLRRHVGECAALVHGKWRGAGSTNLQPVGAWLAQDGGTHASVVFRQVRPSDPPVMWQ